MLFYSPSLQTFLYDPGTYPLYKPGTIEVTFRFYLAMLSDDMQTHSDIK